MRLETAIDAFLDDLRAAKKSPHTVEAYGRDLRLVTAHMDDVEEVADVTVQVLRRAFARRATSTSAATMGRTHSAWRAFFGFLRSEGVATSNPTDEIPRASAGSQAVRSIQVDGLIQRLLAAAGGSTTRSAWPARDVAILALLAQAGLRLAELTGLTVGARTGTPGARQVTVLGKGRKTRTIPLTDAVDALIEGYFAERRQRFPDHVLEDHRTPLFVTNEGTPITRRQVQYLVERVYREAGVRGAVPAGALVHALRHTFAMDLLGHGADIVELQTLLGHASLNTTRRYLAAQPDQLRAAVATSRAAADIARFADGTEGAGGR